ncbi:MAG TPA: hypothetical protein VEZ90_07055 [Blastocatellia bacterium]|nr:hypothetical protein [Blastocatellia bacterium]
MKFTKTISREVEISGTTFIVTLDETGASFRIKGKRRSSQIDWTKILNASTGEQGEAASEYLGWSKVQTAPHSPVTAESRTNEVNKEHGKEESGAITESAMSASAANPDNN